MRVWSLGQEYPPEKEMAAHSSIWPEKIPWTEEPGRPQSLGCKERDATKGLAPPLWLWDRSHMKGALLTSYLADAGAQWYNLPEAGMTRGTAVPRSSEVFYSWKTRAQAFPALSQKHHIHCVLRWRDTKASLQGRGVRKHHIPQVIMVSMIMKMMHRISL